MRHRFTLLSANYKLQMSDNDNISDSENIKINENQPPVKKVKFYETQNAARSKMFLPIANRFLQNTQSCHSSQRIVHFLFAS